MAGAQAFSFTQEDFNMAGESLLIKLAEKVVDKDLEELAGSDLLPRPRQGELLFWLW